MSNNKTSLLLEMPSAFLALLIQHTASGPGGLASAAALSQTCTFLHSLSEGPAVTYSNIHVPGRILSPDETVWECFTKKSGRVAGLNLELCVETHNVDSPAHDEELGWENEPPENDELHQWTQPMQTLSGIPGVQLRVTWRGRSAHWDHLYITRWLRQHGKTMNHLSVQVYISEDSLKLRDFAEAAAMCRSIDLEILHGNGVTIDLAELAALSGSLGRLLCECDSEDGFGIVRGLSASSSLQQLQQLTSLCLVNNEDLSDEQPWVHLAKLTNLGELYIDARASGDPSPLSALTRLSYLHLVSGNSIDSHADPFSLSSLQPLSTLQQLERLRLSPHACTATSLQGLAGLSKLKMLELASGALRSLEGIGSGVDDLYIGGASDLVSLVGIECCSRMTSLSLSQCGMSSLHPLAGLSSIKHLGLCCCITSLEDLSGMSVQFLTLRHCKSLTHLSRIEQLKALKRLTVSWCGVTSLQPLSHLGAGIESLHINGCRKVQEVVLELPHVQPSAHVWVLDCSVREVVLAGGEKRAVG
jgi:hypothetical protein